MGIWQSLAMGLDDALANAWELIRTHMQHPDHSEGPRAMVEQREPRWLPYVGT